MVTKLEWQLLLAGEHGGFGAGEKFALARA
jgi:hypothetical protein